MLTHYLKIAFRNLWKHKVQSLTGIFGLAFAIACFVPALYWIRYETSYDNFYPESENIYRVYSFNKQTGENNELVSGILGKTLREQDPIMQNSTVFFIEQNNCKTEDVPYLRLRTVFTDSTFFAVFPQTVISGEMRQPLQIVNNVVLTETAAIKLFGDVEKAIGQKIKSISLEADPSYTVTAVVKDPPANTNLSFDAILSHEQIKQQKEYIDSSNKAIWTFAFLQMYAKLPPYTDVKYISDKLRDYPSKSYANENLELRILPISEVRHHLDSDVPFTEGFIHLLIAVVALLLFCALFNFLSLHLDLYRQRAREFDLRNIHGALRGQLTLQMLFEMSCTLLLIFLLSYYLVIVATPWFTQLVGITMQILQLSYLFIGCGVGIIILVLCISYILFDRLSRSVVRVRSEKVITNRPVLQRAAVVFQLAVSIIFIVATSIVMLQMHFISNKDLGFKKEGLVYLSGLSSFINEDKRVELLKELNSIPQVEKITDTNFTPQHTMNPFNMTTKVEWSGKQLSDETAFNFVSTDSLFAQTFHIKMLEGKWLSEMGEHQVVLNEEAVRVMKLTNPIGSVIRITLNEVQECRVVGVIKDFHTLSLRNHIPPTIFIKSSYPANNLYIRTVQDGEQEVIRRVKNILPRVDITFTDVDPITMDQVYEQLNYSEQTGLKIFSVLSAICLLLSLFGVYAMSVASTHRRRKEIAIRKVMGAKMDDIIRLFFREYIRQVIIAGIIALPLAYWVMEHWLQGYAYRIDISGWLLFAVILGIIAVVLLTVFGQILKAANGNPAEVVKSE